MPKPVPLPPILKGELSAPFLGTPDVTSPEVIVNSNIGWHAFTHALGVAGPMNLRNGRAARHAVEALMRAGR